MASVHDRYQVQEAALDGDMGDVRGPGLIAPVDGEPLEKAGGTPGVGDGVWWSAVLGRWPVAP